jgi:sigma-B regulation protein RsbU (phosphoserine phosphatase)
LIPKGLPACEAFEVRGLLESAREVGGDFYDFFWADPEHLCLAIGDVSGKGVPAALFMAVSRTILRAYFRKGDPADTLMHLNDELAAENEAHMFVSLFCAVIHVPSGECCYANGGHQPPVLVRRGKAEFLPKVRGALVGVMPGISFTEGRFTLEEGDRLFLYTDGVTEAMDASSALYGEARMLATLSSLGEADCAGILAGMRSALRAFVGNAEQSDDITMLVFRYGGVAESHEGGPRGRGGEIVSP